MKQVRKRLKYNRVLEKYSFIPYTHNMEKNKYVIKPGSPRPLGAHVQNNTVNFALFSRHSESVELLLYRHPEDMEPEVVISLNDSSHKTGDNWHIAIEKHKDLKYYLFRINGEWNPKKGHLFDGENLLLDPYARAITGEFKWNLGAQGTMPKCIIIEDDFDWEGDRPLNIPLQYCTIYETHLAGLTKGPSGNFKHPGTYKGVTELIPYFKELGITSLEFLPLFEFDSFEGSRKHPETELHLENYWGYSTVAFFAPKASYAWSSKNGAQVNEFKEMVKELHKAGIEVILDVVFNHTGEGNHNGPIYAFKGLDNSIYYMLERDRNKYKNYSGCGNTFNCNHPVVSDFIIDCLHYWVLDMHVDGFRFDLASILARDEKGELIDTAPLTRRIAEDPLLRDTKIIAEPWDAGGGYQTGAFPGTRWAEWNDRYRDDIRQFWRGDSSYFKRAATRIAGSSDLYHHLGKKPYHSINFITAHDGFTLYDLYSYNYKHNHANGEDNRDGSNNNLSFNHGVEGHTEDKEVLMLRKKQVKNALATLFLSQGTPMMLGGDEIGRTQHGNNNAYCQNNEISWFNWNLKEINSDLLRFCREIIRFRKDHPAFHRPDFYSGEDLSKNTLPDISWYTYSGNPMNWNEEHLCLAFLLDGSKAEIFAEEDDFDFYVMLNSTNDDLEFHFLGAPQNRRWVRKVDTSRECPEDIIEGEEYRELENQNNYLVKAKSLVLLHSVDV